MKALFDAIWNRVVVNWVPTLIGIVAAVGIVVLDQLTTWSASLNLPSWAASVVAGLIALAGAYLKTKATDAPSP